MKRGAMDLLYVGLGLGLVLLIAGATSCSVSSIEQPDLALACTATGPTACKADLAPPPPPDGMPPLDGMMPAADGMLGPASCTSDTDCKTACPMGSKGCKCAQLLTGTSKGCSPTCTTTADCPMPPMGTVSCDTTQGACLVKP